MRLCALDGCERRHRAKGLCSVHYARKFRTGCAVSAHRSSCDVGGCERKHKAKGFCSNHYRAFRLYGDPLATKLRDTCSICDGSHYCRGFCYYHWNVWRSLQREAEPMPARVPVDPLRPHLTRLVERYGYTFAEEKLTLTKGHLQNIVERNKSVDLDTADRICLQLGLPFDALFNAEAS